MRSGKALQQVDHVHWNYNKHCQCEHVINADVNAVRNIKENALCETPRVVEAVDEVVNSGGLNPPIEIKSSV